MQDKFDAVHRSLDPSHGRAFTAEEIAGLLRTHVGPLGHLERGPGALPLDAIVTEVADRAAVLQALEPSWAAGRRPASSARTDGTLTVSFSGVVVHRLADLERAAVSAPGRGRSGRTRR